MRNYIYKLGRVFMFVFSVGMFSAVALANIQQCESSFDNCYFNCSSGDAGCKIECFNTLSPCMEANGCQIDQAGAESILGGLLSGGIDNNTVIDAFACPTDDQ